MKTQYLNKLISIHKNFLHYQICTVKAFIITTFFYMYKEQLNIN